MNNLQAKNHQKKSLRNSYSSSGEWSRELVSASLKSPTKDYTKPVDVKLYTQDRALKRAMFNYSVATKMYELQQKKIKEDMHRKMLEEKEIKMMRKEMVPKAQLMPLFDRPFFPQRSNRPLTIPKEPSFYANIEGKYWMRNKLYHTFQPCYTMRPIK